MNLIKVSSQSNPNSVAGAIASIIRENGSADMQVIGAGALNQGMKAVAIARGFLVADGIDLVCSPAFTEVTIEGEIRTALRLSLTDRHAAVAPHEATLETAPGKVETPQDAPGTG